MGLREEALAEQLSNRAATCMVRLLADGIAQALDPTKPIDHPDRLDVLDVMNVSDESDPGFVRASDLQRALAKRNVKLAQDSITRHRRRDCQCVGEYRGER